MLQHDNRRSFRIKETMFLRYEALTEQDFQDGIDRYKLRHGHDADAHAQIVDIDARLSEAMFKMNGEAESICRLITLLNDKVNVVMQMLPGFAKSREALAKMPPQVCEIGADGMVFSAESLIPVDTKLHLSFLLESDNRFMESFCRVVRHVDSPHDGSAGLKYGIAVEFHGMRPEQRETLIQYMFSRETETLRLRRLEIEAKEYNS